LFDVNEKIDFLINFLRLIFLFGIRCSTTEINFLPSLCSRLVLPFSGFSHPLRYVLSLCPVRFGCPVFLSCSHDPLLTEFFVEHVGYSVFLVANFVFCAHELSGSHCSKDL
jgi:hypothetical protein